MITVALIVGSFISCGGKKEEETTQNVKKYKVNIELTCEENLIFSRYDVKVFVDDMEIGLLNHGTTDTFKTELEKDEHQLQLKGEESADGNIGFTVENDSTFKYEIRCSSEQIVIEFVSSKLDLPTEKVVLKDNLESGELTTPETTKPVSTTQDPHIEAAHEKADECVNKSVTDAEDTLKDTGYKIKYLSCLENLSFEQRQYTEVVNEDSNDFLF